MLALLAAGCGGSSGGSAASTQVTGSGWSFTAPGGWQVRRRPGLVEARHGDAVVSVAVTALARPFRDSLWNEAVREMDVRARQFAAAAGARVTSSATREIGGSRARVYEVGGTRRLAFVLRGRANYTLYCRNAGSACDDLFSSFRLRGA